jgi:metal-dependent HD superfamily phosphatase/phosphodiesterase
MMRSPKQIGLETAIMKGLSGAVRKAAETLLNDEEVQALQEYANTVSIKRLAHGRNSPRGGHPLKS